MQLNTDLPPWLVAQPHQDSPWMLQALQQGMERERMRQTLPLEIQRAQLQNQATQAAIEHQGLANEIAGAKWKQYRDELPAVQDWMKQTQGRPDLILNLPAPAVTNEDHQKMIMQAKRLAAESAYGRALLARETADIQMSTKLLEEGGTPPEPILNPITGAYEYPPGAMGRAFGSALDAATQRKVQEKNAELSPAAKESEDYARYKRQERQLQRALLKKDDEHPDQQRVYQELLGDVQNKIQEMEARHNMEEISVQGPGGEQVKIVRGQKGKEVGGLTTGEETRLGEDVQASSNALRVLNDLQRQLDSGAVGVIPAINSVVFDRVLGQFDQNLVNEKRVTARQNIGIATQQVLGELNSRGRFSNMELNAIKNLMPGLGASESPERSKIAVKGLRKVLAEKGAHAAVALKREVPTEIVHALAEYSDVELADEVKSGSLDKETFWKVYNFKHPGAK